jgi:hypothetical protein
MGRVNKKKRYIDLLLTKAFMCMYSVYDLFHKVEEKYNQETVHSKRKLFVLNCIYIAICL